MSADQVAEIAPPIREALAGGPGLCATFVVSGQSQAWLQFVDGVINAAYPAAAEPASVLAELGSATLQNWEAGKYLTAALVLGDARAIAKWIDGYFEKVLSAGSEYALDVSLERL
jgi:hypothetical protein